MLHWYHPQYFPITTLEYHHHNNISEQQGTNVNKGNIRFTCQQCHYPAGCVKHMPCDPIWPSFLAVLKDHSCLIYDYNALL